MRVWKMTVLISQFLVEHALDVVVRVRESEMYLVHTAGHTYMATSCSMYVQNSLTNC